MVWRVLSVKAAQLSTGFGLHSQAIPFKGKSANQTSVQ